MVVLELPKEKDHPLELRKSVWHLIPSCFHVRSNQSVWGATRGIVLPRLGIT